MKVEVNRVGNPSRVQLVIYDSKGNQYIFNDEEETKLYIANNPLNCNATNPRDKFDDKITNFVEWTPIRIRNEELMEPGPVDPYPYTSCWCVTKIITSKNKVINFTYEMENQELPTQESCEIYNSSRSANKLYARSKVVNKALRLKAITWDFGRVEFSAGKRDDIKGDAKFKGVTKPANFDKSVVGTLKSIEYPTGGKSEFEYELNHFGITFGNRTNNDLGGEFVTNPDESQWVTFRTENICVYNNYSKGEYPDYPSDTIFRFELPVKTKITITGRVENTNCTFRDPNYMYNSDPLGELYQISPTKKKYFTDVCPAVYLKETGSSTNYDGEGDELPLFPRSYMLEPGTYEFHAYRPPKDVLADWQIILDYQSPVRKTRSSYIESGAGLRIAKIRTDAVTKTYSYSIGTYLTEPILYYYGNRVGDGTGTSGSESCLVQVSESKTPLSTFNGGYYVGYDWVEENVVGDDNPSQIKHYFMNEQESELFDDKFIESPVIINYTNGLPTKVEYSCDDVLMKTDKFDYNETSSDYVYAFIDRVGNFSTGNVLNYYYKVHWPQLSSKEEVLTYSDNEISTRENYTYNSYGLLSHVSKALDGDSFQTQLKYPFDYQNTVCKTMVTKNILNEPLEIISLKNGNVITGQKKEFIDTLNMVLPKVAYKLGITQPVSLSNYQSAYYKFKTFDKYDKYGNLVQYTENGIPVVYIWGYRGQYPIAEIRNSNYSKVYSFLGGENVVQTFCDKSKLSDSEVKSFLSPILEGRLSSASVSVYTHIPMIGVNSITNSFGYSTSFEYDSGNRLNAIKNTESQLLEHFSYHYKY